MDRSKRPNHAATGRGSSLHRTGGKALVTRASKSLLGRLERCLEKLGPVWATVAMTALAVMAALTIHVIEDRDRARTLTISARSIFPCKV